MNGETPVDLLVLFGLVLSGMTVQFIKKMADLEASGTLLTPWQHYRQKPWGALLLLISTMFLAYSLFIAGQLNEFAAMSVGFCCNEAYDSLRARAVGRMGEITGQKQTPADQPPA